MPFDQTPQDQLDPQVLYCAVQELQAKVLDSSRCNRFDQLGGVSHPPEPDAWTFEESLWHIRLHGIWASGKTKAKAIDAWIANAMERVPRRATDGRPVDPYDGQGLAPATPS